MRAQIAEGGGKEHEGDVEAANNAFPKHEECHAEKHGHRKPGQPPKQWIGRVLADEPFVGGPCRYPEGERTDDDARPHAASPMRRSIRRCAIPTSMTNTAAIAAAANNADQICTVCP